MRTASLSVTFFILFIISGFSQGQIEKLSSLVNTEDYDESAPILSKDGSTLFFTRTAYPDFEASLMNEEGQLTTNKDDQLFEDRLSEIYSEIAGKPVNDPYNSVFNQDIWIVSIENDSIINPVHPGYPLNNALPNSLVSTGMTPDEYVIINQFFTDGSMNSGFSRVRISEDGNHSFPEPMHIYNFNISSSDVNLTMSPAGHVLILSMERHDSKGFNDLYVSFYMRENVWSPPEHMESVMNTEFQETTPHISPDKKFLYFSSNRPNGVGGNDIYVSERLDYTWLKWSEPILLKGEVNSAFDDSQPSFTRGNNYMYFTSRRDGSSDIFRMRLTTMPRLKKPVVVNGTIVDASTGKTIRSELIWGPQSTKDYLEFFSSYNGHFRAILSEYEPYKFLPKKTGYIAQRIMVDPRIIEKGGEDTIEIILYLAPKDREDLIADAETGNTRGTITKNNTTQTSGSQSANKAASDEDNSASAGKGSTPPSERSSFIYDIYFVKTKPIILTKSLNALQELSEMMKRNPAMEILIEGHTDNVGDEVALIHLSEQRAAAVGDYLMHEGINGQRIQTRGFGATRPIHKNDTESGREKNRRVEIKIMKEKE